MLELLGPGRDLVEEGAVGAVPVAVPGEVADDVPRGASAVVAVGVPEHPDARRLQSGGDLGEGLVGAVAGAAGRVEDDPVEAGCGRDDRVPFGGAGGRVLVVRDQESAHRWAVALPSRAHTRTAWTTAAVP